MDPAKVDSIMDWPVPQMLTHLQSFLGFINFYRCFVPDFSKRCLPLTSLLGKSKKIDWGPEAQQAFEAIKVLFSDWKHGLLAFFDPGRQTIVETDASDRAMGAVLSQLGEDSKLRPVAFHSRKFTPPEVNYDVHDRELLAIVEAIEAWRVYLTGSQFQVAVYMDHKNLEYFTTSKKLNSRQARWSALLADYDFQIKYRPGSLNARADALSRR